MTIIGRFILVLLLGSVYVYSQGMQPKKDFYSFGFAVGKSLPDLKEFASFEKQYYNFALLVGINNWPGQINFQYRSNFHFRLDEGPYSNGFLTSIQEFDLIYNYFVEFPNDPSVCVSFGAGFGAVFARRRGRPINEEETTINTIIKPGIPVELKWNIISENKYSFDSLAICIYMNINSEANILGLSIGYNWGSKKLRMFL